MAQDGTFLDETNIAVPDGELSPDDCKSMSDALARVGDKWTIRAVGALARGALRYNEIQRHLDGVSQRMLTLALKRLEVDGIVTRTVFPTVPPRVDYELTQLGHTLRGALVPLHLWASKHRGVIEQNRRNATKPPA